MTILLYNNQKYIVFKLKILRETTNTRRCQRTK